MATMENTQSTTPAITDGDKPIAIPPGHKLFTYFFKTETLKDEEGKEIGKGKKHPDVKVAVPVPSIEEVITFLAAADGTKEAKVRDLIMDQIADAIFLAGRAQINEFRDANPDKEFAATNMDAAKLSLQVIAETPKGQRGAWSPSDDDFKAFNELYTNVLVHKVSYDPKKTKTHTDHWKNGMAKVKNNKPVVGKLAEFLTVFAANCEEEDMKEIEQTYTWLSNRAAKYLKAEEKDFLEAL
jgi:hypothetical protein